MITITIGRPSDLVQQLSIMNIMHTNHLRINTNSHFWHTDDDLSPLVQALSRLRNLECLEFMGHSFPTLFSITEFITFLHDSPCDIKKLILPISPPFPGQYCIQDRHFMVNKILHTVHRKKSLEIVHFYSKNSVTDEFRGDESICFQEDNWIVQLNKKIKSLLRNHRYSHQSHL